MYLNTAPTDRSTVYVVRPNKTIELEDGVTLGPGSEVVGDTVPNAWADYLYLKQTVPTTPTDQQITDDLLEIP